MTQAPPRAEPDVTRRAHRLVLACLALVLISIGVGGSWDRAWHTREPFDDFFSPPHLFIYGTVAAAMCVFVVLATDRRTVRAFGEPIRILGWNHVLPGPVALLGAGLGGIGAAGALDAIWHTRYGLDETNFSAPHKLLGTSIFLVVLGYISCRLASNERALSSGLLPYALGFLVIAGSSSTIVGPFEQRSLDWIAAIARIPVIAADESARRMFHIYDHWNITRTNPLVPLLVAFWLVAAVTFVRRLVGRDRVVLAVGGIVALFSFTTDGGEARALGINDGVAPIGLVVLVACFAYVAIRRISHVEPLAWAGTGAVTAAAAFTLWGRQGDGSLALLLSVLAPFIAVAAGRLGLSTYEVVARPRGRALCVLVGVTCGTIPFATGAVDLLLRAHTP